MCSRQPPLLESQVRRRDARHDVTRDFTPLGRDHPAGVETIGQEENVSTTSHGSYAVVIGASMAGLPARRELPDHFERVTESLPRARAALMARPGAARQEGRWRDE